jgi:outer membrane receptor protein involved in Fe transport
MVKDSQGGVLPGVSITLSGEAVLGEPLAVTELDGSYVFRALSPGIYGLRFELAGFSTLVREGVVVTTGHTVAIHATLELAGVKESLTVTGQSPTVDVKTTRVGGTFGESALQDVPSATDTWAVLAQSPGIRMLGYDVGGSHKRQQTLYETFGIFGQNRIISDGVDSTEGDGYAGFYYDYYSIEEFQMSASGADVEMTSPGASVVMTVKSGGDELSGLFHLDYEGEGMVGENTDEDLAARGYTGNPNLLFWEAHADLGGPIVRDKAWFYGAYNHFYLDQVRSGVDREIATERSPFDNYVGKLTFQLSEKDRFIGYSQWGRKQNFNRGLSALGPFESAVNQDTWSWVHKAEWQRLWSGRLFSNVQAKHYGTGGRFIPNTDPAAAPWRVDTSTGIRSGPSRAGVVEYWKPQASAQLSYYLPTASGSHDFKFGFDWLIQSEGFHTEAPAIFYFDNSRLGRPMNVDEIEFYNYPVHPDDRDAHLDFYAQDIWTLSDRLTLSLGVRFNRQHAYYTDSSLEPALPEFFTSGFREGKTLVTWNNVAPRLGVTFDVTGDGKTAVKAHFGRYYVNIASWLYLANPNGDALQRYKFLDPNENGLYEGLHELGPLVFRTSEGEGTPVNPDLTPAYADELSLSLEHEVAADTSVRASYVHKNLKNLYGVWNRAQEIPLRERGIPCGDVVFPCPTDPFTGAPLHIARVPGDAAFALDVAYDTFPDSDQSWDTLQIAFNRRFVSGFFVQGSFDYQWRDELRSANDDNRMAFNSFSIQQAGPGQILWQNHSRDVFYRQPNTGWVAKFLGRYVFPRDIAVSTNIRHQSGFPWAPIHRIPIPGSGTQPVLLEDLSNNRSDDVTIVDVRLEKTFALNERHRVSGMVDVYNVLNSNPVTSFTQRTGGNFGTVIAALPPRTLKVGVRWQF